MSTNGVGQMNGELVVQTKEEGSHLPLRPSSLRSPDRISRTKAVQLAIEESSHDDEAVSWGDLKVALDSVVKALHDAVLDKVISELRDRVEELTLDLNNRLKEIVAEQSALLAANIAKSLPAAQVFCPPTEVRVEPSPVSVTVMPAKKERKSIIYDEWGRPETIVTEESPA